MLKKLKERFMALTKIPYSTEYFIITMVIASFVKIVLFSLGIEAPQVEWNWRLFTVVVFTIANISILAVLYSIVLFQNKKSSQVFLGLVINFLLTVIIVANQVYYMFFSSYITLQTVAHSTEGLSMFQAIYSTIRMGEVLWFIDIPVLYFIFIRQPGNSGENFASLKNMVKKNGRVGLSKFMTVFLIVSLTILVWTPVLSMYADTSEGHHNIKLKESGPLMFYTQEAVAQTPMVEEKQVGVGEKKLIEQWFSEAREEKNNDRFFGEMEGKNLILLQVEALQNVVIDKEINGQEITPNINEIIDNSLFFEKTYDQTDMATADAEALVNFSLYPPGNVSAYMQYPENNFNSLPRTLKERDYTTAAFHGFEKEFYNREKAYPNVGYEKFFSQEDFEQDEMYDDLLGDKTFLRQSVDYIKNLEEPFFSFVITLTSHHPFNYIDKEDYDEIDVGPYEQSIVGDYIRSIHYTDAAVGKFYEKLNRTGILDDTVLVLYGDHAAFNYNERDYKQLNRFFGVNVRKPKEQVKIHKVPFAIYDPGEKELVGTHEEKIGMIDIFPTLINLFGVDNPYLLGRDVLNFDKDLIVFRDGSFIKDELYYLSSRKKFYNIHSGREVNVEEEKKEQLVARVERKLEISDLIYKTDFFDYMEKTSR